MSDIKTLEIPKWGLSMEEGKIVEWLIAEGDSFEQDQEICEIETSKIVNSLEAPFDGVLRRILAQDGETLAVQAPIAVVADADVSDQDIENFIATLSGSDSKGEVASEVNETVPLQAASGEESLRVIAPVSEPSNGIPAALKSDEDDTAVSATHHARRLAKQYGINLTRVSGSGRGKRVSVEDLRQAVVEAGGAFPTSGSSNAGTRATPITKRLAGLHGIDLADRNGTGSGGKITKEDVEAALAGPDSASGVIIPMDSMRRTIASRLQASQANAPHVRFAIDVELDELLALRQQINTADSHVKVSVNDFFIKACAMALVKVPGCNIQYDGETLRQFGEADISVAVTVEGGLITPIVRAANLKGLIEISNEVRALVTRAKAGTLAPDDFQGGTFTISNLGMFGIKQFDSIINPPQGAILSVGAGERRIVVKNDEPKVATVATITLAVDHRVIDGAMAAQLLQALKPMLEQPGMHAVI